MNVLKTTKSTIQTLKKQAHITSFVFLFFAFIGNCCVNEYRALLNGDIVFTDVGNSAPRPRFDIHNRAFLLEKLHEADSIYRKTGKVEDYSDYGVLLLYTGAHQDAKKIFLEIEKKSPDRYNTAANLGTTYELLGQNDSALIWIKKALDIKATSHEGSEWIHIKILEAKLKMQYKEQSSWQQHILSLDFGKGKKPEKPGHYDLELLGRHIYVQLSERMSFVSPKDPIVAQLLFDLGNIYALTRDVKSALQVFELAENYGYASDVFDRRKNYFQKLQARADFVTRAKETMRENPATVALISLVIGIGILFFVVQLIRRFIRNFKNTKSIMP